MEIAPGLHTFPQTITRDGQEVTIHPAAVETPRGVILIDVGFPGFLQLIGDNLAVADLDWDDVRAVLVTHHDGDHAGALADVVDRTGAVVYAHKRCAPYLDGRMDTEKSPEGERYPPADVDVELVEDVRFRTAAGPLEVVFTPGHTAGHVSLSVPGERLLLAADALTADEDGLAGPSEAFTLDVDEALDSTERLAALDIQRILCYHGGLVEADGERIREVVAEQR